ncbi:MAG: aldo/keto reductase [Chitinophagaceae bacterium]
MISIDKLSNLGLGTSNVASLGRKISFKYYKETIATAKDAGINVIDTADTYGSGDSERLIGKCLKENRSSFFIITKAGIPYTHSAEWLFPLNQIGKKVKQKLGYRTNYSSTYLIKSINLSIKRIGTNYVNAFLLHEPNYTDLENTDCWKGLEKIRKTGLAEYTGVSTNDYKVVEEGIRAKQVQLVQTSVSWDDKSSPIIDLCHENQIPVIANQVLRPYKSLIQKFMQKEKYIHELEGLSQISLIQFLIAYILVEKTVASVLIGTGNIEHLNHNINSVNYTASLKHHLDYIKNVLI